MDFQAAINIIQKNIVDVNFIYVFGSHAQNKNTYNSDLDLAFNSSKEINNLSVYNTAQEIAATYNMDVDLIDSSKAGDTLKMEVIYKGISIFSHSLHDIKLFESRIVEDYIDYKELIQSME